MTRPMTASLRALVLLPLTVTSATAAADPAPSPRTRLHLALVLGGTAVYVSTETVFKEALAPDHCRWCGRNGLDENVADAMAWADPDLASSISDVLAFAATPLVSGGLLAVAGRGDDRWLADGLAVAESAVATGLITQLVKISAGRRRAFVELDGTPTIEDNLSFFSGHTSLAFAVATSAGTVASLRGDRLAPWIWGSGLALASTVGYLRIAADRHWFTDVATGAVVGSAIGVAVPRLFHRHLRIGDHEVAVALAPGRLLVGGAF
jgi:membrane-associated phospholipid phosphatase